MDSMLLIIVGGGGLVLALLLAGAVVSIRSEKALVDNRLERYIGEEAAAAPEGERATPVSDWLNDRLAGSSFGGGIAKELARADLKLKPAEYVLTEFLGAGGVGLIAWYIGGRSLIFAALGAALGWSLPRLYVKKEQANRLKKFNDQLADMINLMVNGLRAGYSILQAMESVSREMPAPIADEFRRVVQEMQIGLPMDRALDNLLRRITSDDLDLMITAINVQREVGGNLAEILDTISYTIRERVRIKGEIQVMTSQVMYSGRFLAMMPLFISGILWVLNRAYMMEFFNPETRVAGIIALSIGGMMVMAGYFVMVKIATIEV